MNVEKTLRILTNIHFDRMKTGGYEVAKDDVLSEVGFAIARAMKSFEDADTGVKIETYVSRAVKNHISNFCKKLRIRKKTPMFELGEAMECGYIPLLDFPTQRHHATTMRDIMTQLETDRQRVIVHELFCPSHKVAEINKILCNKKVKRSRMAHAIGAVYGVTPKTIQDDIEKAKNCLTLD